MIQFAYTILYVQDVAKAVAFYEQALGLTSKFMIPDGSYGEMISGNTTISFASIALASSNLKDGFIESSIHQKPFGIELGFTTTDVDATIEQALAAGGILVEAPKTKPWGQVVAYIRDLDGFLLEICTPLKG